MNVAEMHMANGVKKLDEFDLDMAAFYFEIAAEKFLESNNISSAIEAYEKALYCFETDEKLDRVDEIKTKINTLKSK